MNIPKQMADEMASIEAEIAGIKADAERRVASLQDRLKIFSFVVDAFRSQEEVMQPPNRHKLAVPFPLADGDISAADRIVAVLTNAGRPMSAPEIIGALSKHGFNRSTVTARLSLLAKEGRISHEGIGQWAA